MRLRKRILRKADAEYSGVYGILQDCIENGVITSVDGEIERRTEKIVKEGKEKNASINYFRLSYDISANISDLSDEEKVVAEEILSNNSMDRKNLFIGKTKEAMEKLVSTFIRRKKIYEDYIYPRDIELDKIGVFGAGIADNKLTVSVEYME
jgi:hypothetical protein